MYNHTVAWIRDPRITFPLLYRLSYPAFTITGVLVGSAYHKVHFLMCLIWPIYYAVQQHHFILFISSSRYGQSFFLFLGLSKSLRYDFRPSAKIKFAFQFLFYFKSLPFNSGAEILHFYIFYFIWKLFYLMNPSFFILFLF